MALRYTALKGYRASTKIAFDAQNLAAEKRLAAFATAGRSDTMPYWHPRSPKQPRTFWQAEKTYKLAVQSCSEGNRQPEYLLPAPNINVLKSSAQ